MRPHPVTARKACRAVCVQRAVPGKRCMTCGCVNTPTGMRSGCTRARPRYGRRSRLRYGALSPAHRVLCVCSSLVPWHAYTTKRREESACAFACDRRAAERHARAGQPPRCDPLVFCHRRLVSALAHTSGAGPTTADRCSRRSRRLAPCPMSSSGRSCAPCRQRALMAPGDVRLRRVGQRHGRTPMEVHCRSNRHPAQEQHATRPALAHVLPRQRLVALMCRPHSSGQALGPH